MERLLILFSTSRRTSSLEVRRIGEELRGKGVAINLLKRDDTNCGGWYTPVSMPFDYDSSGMFAVLNLLMGIQRAEDRKMMGVNFYSSGGSSPT